ncbi:hypothetical protein [Chitinophaga sp.]|uniref:hypothetical protein n=1 Tax=Chitinophaga sp. TaxID=1869181 RepID=UPI00260B8A0C|nr:hypothetical protein [uncultured Chitinophaga sp.]
MAKATDNLLLHGVSGTLGGQFVIRQHMGKSIICKRPRKFTGGPTEGLGNVREKFQMSSVYARSMKNDPDVYAAYKASARNGQSAYNVAMADCFNAPEIREIDTDAYTGKAGDKIRIRAVDDFLVKDVHLTMFSPDGSLLEEGAATANGNGFDWYFSAKKVNAALSGTRIRIQVFDLAGNVAEQENVL